MSSGDYYVQATWDAAMPALQLEAVSNELLPAKAQLDGEREQALRALGFAPPGKDENFSRTFERVDAEPARLARLAADAFSRAFRVPPEGWATWAKSRGPRCAVP